MALASDSSPNAEQPTPRARLPSLDGLRALAIALVLLDHVARGRWVGRWPWLAPLFGRGSLGVQIFFVISGFLITTLLTKELGASRKISLRGFYLRRVFRILPAFYTYVVFVLMLGAVGRLVLDYPALFHALTFTSNFQRWNGDWWFGHIWSLSVEEQFYLVWPIALSLLGTRRATVASFGVLLICPVVRLGWFLHDPESAEALQWTTPFVADAVATGCLTALLLPRLSEFPRLERLVDSGAAPLMGIGLLLIDLERPHPKAFWSLGYSLISLGAALLMVHAIRATRGPLFALLNQRWVVAVGVGSYSIYLWQQLFLNTYTGFGRLTEPPLSLVVTLAFATCSYRFVEKPFLALRRRLFPDRALLARPSVE